MATIGKVTRTVRGKAYEYHAVRFTDPGTGKEKTRYFKSAGEAKAARTKLETAISGGTYSSDSHRLLIRELVDRFRKAAYFPKGEDALRSTTVSDYETALTERILPRWGAVRVTDIRASMVEAWRDDMLRAGQGKSPVRKALVVMGRLFRFAGRDHIVTHNPTVDVSKPAVRSRKGEDERLTPTQLGSLFQTLQGRTLVIVRIGAGAGLREGEIFGLRWRDVGLESRTLNVRGQYTHGEFVEHPKTTAGHRVVPMDGELVKTLAAWKLSLVPERKQPDSLVASTSTGGPISASNFLLRDFYPALERAGLPRVVFHSLRHTYKTVLVSTDLPPAVVHTIIGHADFRTTMKLYGGITDEARNKVGDRITAAFSVVPDKNRTNAEQFSSTSEGKVQK